MTATMAAVSSSSSPRSRARSDSPTLYGTRTPTPSLSSGFASSARFSYLSRSSSPSRVSMYRRSASLSSPSVRLGAGRRVSRQRSSISVAKQRNSCLSDGGKDNCSGKGDGSGSGTVSGKKEACLCSPTTHPGSFRCCLHRKSPPGGRDQTTQSFRSSYSSQLNLMRSAMTNSLVRIGVEGDLVKTALSASIRPSSHHQRRRSGFEPRPSRLSIMCRAEDS